MQPASYKRRVLLCATGLSPQVVTETMYALAIKQEPAFVPTEVHVISTSEGAERAAIDLLHADRNQFGKLLQAYNLPSIEFTTDNIHVIRSADGQPLKDIDDATANTACADAMIQLVQAITSNADSALHVSIAGGRKTMGYLLGYALTLLGREQDRMSHVLVSSPYESLRDFYFPTPTSHILHTRDDKPIDASKAKVQLATIPYVNLRSGMATMIAERGETFSSVIRKANQIYRGSSVLVNIGQRSIGMAEFKVTLKPQEFLLWLWLARRACAGLPPVSRTAFDRDSRLREAFRVSTENEADLDRKSYRSSEDLWNPDDPSRPHPMHAEAAKWLGERVNGINKAFRKELGDVGVQHLGILSEGKQNATSYGLSIDPSRLHFE